MRWRSCIGPLTPRRFERAIPTPRGGWSADEVADYFIQASRTAHKLPPVRVQGHFNVWPTIVRTDYERMASDDAPVYRFPPTPAEVDCMLEVMGWVQWLEVEQRHLVWMRAARYRWYDIGKRFGCAPRTAQRRWEIAMYIVASNLVQGSLVR